MIYVLFFFKRLENVLFKRSKEKSGVSDSVVPHRLLANSIKCFEQWHQGHFSIIITSFMSFLFKEVDLLYLPAKIHFDRLMNKVALDLWNFNSFSNSLYQKSFIKGKCLWKFISLYNNLTSLLRMYPTFPTLNCYYFDHSCWLANLIPDINQYNWEAIRSHNRPIYKKILQYLAHFFSYNNLHYDLKQQHDCLIKPHQWVRKHSLVAKKSSWKELLESS